MEILLTFLTLLGGATGFFLSRISWTQNKYKFKLLLTQKNIVFSLFSSAITAVTFFIFSKKILLEATSISIQTQIIILIITLVTVTILIFLSLQDIRYLTIPYDITLILLIALVILNLTLIIFWGKDASINLWFLNPYVPLSNITAALISSIFIGIIIYLTKEKGMGAGDFFLAAIFGLLIGTSKLLVGFYTAIISASVVGILYALKVRTFKNIKVPFVPFIVLGSFVAILWGREIQVFFQSLFSIY